MSLVRRYRARSDMTLAEAARRQAALAAVPAPARALPPSIVAERLAARPAEPAAAAVANEDAAAAPAAAIAAICPAPVVTITISGPRRSGKSVVSHLIRAALAHEGVAFDGPDELRSVMPRQGLADLIRRGLRVELVKTEGP